MIPSREVFTDIVIEREEFSKREAAEFNEVDEVLDIYDSDESSKFEFSSQTEVPFNGYLSYSKRLDGEADNLLTKIKASFGRCVITRDINPGCMFWSQMLFRYIALYGLRFTDDELIAFAKLFYELINISNLQSSTVEIFGRLFVTLLKRKESISPKKLEFQWRPLYELCDKVITHQNKQFAFHRYSLTTETTLHSVVLAAKVYFAPKATQEILDILRPKIYPFDEKSMHTTFKLFQWFLPVQLAVEYHHIGHKLWLSEFMKIWETCHRVVNWESDLMELMANLASNNIGYIDWSPYIPIMYTRFLRNLKLPVDYKVPLSSSNSLQMKHVADWIVSLMNHTNADIYFEKFLKTIQSYYYPANRGPWSENLEELAEQLVINFVSRLRRERLNRNTWVPPTPKYYKLTEKNIDFFVQCMLPVAMIIVYDEEILKRSGCILQYLAMLRPKVVITQLMEKLSFSLDEPIENHKFCAVMDSMILIRKPLILGSKFIDTNQADAYSQGPLIAVQLLFSALPGLDPNDTNKIYKAVCLITAYSQLIPLIDCTRLKLEITEEERLLVDQTARFKEFLLTFMDTVFDLVINGDFKFSILETGGEHYGTSPEAITEKTFEEVFDSLLKQCNEEIFTLALKKFFAIITEKSYEIEFIGKLMAILCNVFCRNNVEITLRTLLPYLSGKIQNAIGSTKKVLESDHLSKDLLFSLELCRCLVKSCRGDQLLPYMITLNYMLKKATFLQNVKGNELAAEILKNILESLITTQPIRFDQNSEDLKYPYWNDWGKSVDINAAKIKWYQPGDKVMAEAEKLFQYFFLNSTKLIQEHANGKRPLPRVQLQRNLRIINATIEGLDVVLPAWSEPPIVIKNCGNCTFTFKPITGKEREIKMPSGRNVRNFLINIMAAVEATILKNDEDDITSFKILTQVWENLSMNQNRNHHDFNVRLSTIRHQRSTMENRITRDKSYSVKLFLDRIRVQHDFRKLQAVYAFTPSTKYIIQNLYILSISKHSVVREKARDTLWAVLNDYTFSYLSIIPNILDTLNLDPIENHEALKGVLSLINKNPKNSFLTKGDWQVLSSILPALVTLISEENSSLIEELRYTSLVLAGHHNSIDSSQLTDNCLSAAFNLWNTLGEPTTIPRPSENEVIKGLNAQKNLYEANLNAYNNILEKLINAVVEQNSTCKYRLLPMQYMSSLINPDHLIPANIVAYFLRALISQHLEERNLGFTVIIQCLRQNKRILKKKLLRISDREKEIKPGRRTDNEWLQYDPKKFPKSIQSWEEPRYLHESWVGYYGWPMSVEIFAPTLVQPPIERQKRKMNQQEVMIDKFFSNRENVRLFIEHLIIGEQDGHKKFNFYHYYLLKNLFRNFGDIHLRHMLPYVKKLSLIKNEHSQRCVVEVLCAIMCGSKHWSYPMNANIWKKVLPLIQEALDNVIEENVEDWVVCFLMVQLNRDPMKIYWLIEFFIEDSENLVANGIVECGKLTLLRCMIKNQVWRLSDPLNRLLPVIEERLLDDPTENVRENLSAAMVAIFNSNLNLQDESQESQITSKNKQLDYPKIENFIERIIVKMKPIMESQESDTLSAVSEHSETESENENENENENEEFPTEEEIEAAIRESMKALVSVSSFIVKSYESSHVSMVPCFYEIYPIIIRFGKLDLFESDKVTEICCEALSALAKFWTRPKYVPIVINTISNVSKSSSCSTVINNMQFLLVWLFHNMSIVLSERTWIFEVREIIFSLLQDNRVEIREKACEMLSCMIYCSIWPDEASLLQEFKKMGQTKLPQRKDIRLGDRIAEREYRNAIRVRHSAVLGMCAFIRAHPYDISDDIPKIFAYLTNHVNDPPPIPITIQSTLNEFKRTHCDSWKGLEVLEKFMTEEQFRILQDFTVPPSYIT